MQSYTMERKLIERKFKKLKENKLNPDDVVLNAAAFQDQLLIDMGLKRKKKIFKKDKGNSINLVPKILTKMMNKELEEEKDKNILNRQKEFLKNLTFAEKIGMKEIEKMPLSINEWKNLEVQSVKRNDHITNCPICLESINKKETLILSCSHIFHKICIRNFEKFTQTKKCPICRCANYESKDYFKDKEIFIHNNIIIIQKYFRGFFLRLSLFRQIFRLEMPKNKHLRSLYSHWKIKELTSKMCSIIEKKSEATKNVIDKLATDLRSIKKKNEKTRGEIENLKDKGNTKDSYFNFDSNDASAWKKLIQNVKSKKNEDCAICLSKLQGKDAYVLSCSHSYHKNCLDSFEKFDTYFEKRCPICRRNYEKKEIKI